MTFIFSTAHLENLIASAKEMSPSTCTREGTFYGCSALENITFADGVVIEDWTFSNPPVVLP